MNCRICGSEIDHETYYCGPQMVKRQLCFTCNFWQNQLEADKERGDYKWAVIDGGHYVIAPEDEKTRFRGFDGQKFIIIFEDGTIVRTTNLWFQGHIPEEWKSQFPDNAVFADNRKWQRLEIVSTLLRLSRRHREAFVRLKLPSVQWLNLT